MLRLGAVGLLVNAPALIALWIATAILFCLEEEQGGHQMDGQGLLENRVAVWC